jgi:uncharacterized protein
MTDTQIYYIHGFGSTTESATVKMLRKDFPDAIGLDYEHTDPETSIRMLIEFINEKSLADGTFPIIVGSSLGGWYAEQLTEAVVANFILYNPSTQPAVTLSRHGLSQDVLSSYEQISSLRKFLPTLRSVLLSVDDEIIDYQIANNKYKDIASVQLTDGGHRMTEKNMQLIVARIKYLQNQLP